MSFSNIGHRKPVSAPSPSTCPFTAVAKAAVESGVKVIETAGNNPEPFLPYLKENGVKVIHKCTSVRHALKAERIGVDAVSVDGFECAGHPGEDDVTNLILLACANEQLSIPMLASGGIGNGYQMASVMALGAEGINMGTRFVATKEAPVHENMKQAMVDASERDTTLIFRTLRNTARVFKNAVAQEVVSIEARPGDTDFMELKDLVAGVRGRERCIEQGELDDGIWSAGMVVGLIHDIPSCEELIQRMVAEAREAVKERLSALI